MIRAVLFATVSLVFAASHAAAQTVFVVRHAERADAGMAGATSMATDPELSETGRARAESLAAMLKDAGITTILVTEYKRTQQTAAPLARALGVAAEAVPAKDLDALMAKVKSAAGNVLIVGHSNTLPGILKRLGIDTPVTVGDADYDNLFVVTGGAKPSLVRLRFR